MTGPLTYHLRFTPEELDKQYNLRTGRPDYETTVISRWMSDSEMARKILKSRLDIRYGKGENQKLDVFTCGDILAPTLVYFHGGYWQRGDKSIYSFLAKPFNETGVNVVVVGYDLCPIVTITEISEEAREAIAYIWENSGELGINANRINAMGHSAGGHITQMMMGTIWSNFCSKLPKDLIKSAISISPLSYLEPVRLTQALNSGIRMDKVEAQSESPITNYPPVTNASQLVIVGGGETTEFHRQAGIYVDAFATRDRKIELFIVPEVDHFDEINVLVDPSSNLFKRIIALLKS